MWKVISTRFLIEHTEFVFAIGTGRFRKIPRDERWCLFCKNQSNAAVIEDEKHILLHCPLYNLYIYKKKNNYTVAWTSYVQTLRI